MADLLSVPLGLRLEPASESPGVEGCSNTDPWVLAPPPRCRWNPRMCHPNSFPAAAAGPATPARHSCSSSSTALILRRGILSFVISVVLWPEIRSFIKEKWKLTSFDYSNLRLLRALSSNRIQ